MNEGGRIGELIFAITAGGVLSYFIGKYYDTNHPRYLASIVLLLICAGVVLLVYYKIMPEK